MNVCCHSGREDQSQSRIRIREAGAEKFKDGGLKMKAIKIVQGCLVALAAQQCSAAVASTGCYGGEGSVLESMVRKEEAIRLTIELDSKIMNALDKVMLSTDASRANPPEVNTNFGKNIKFVLDLQLDPQNMDILIERTPAIKNAQQFIDAWAGLTSFFKYRKRNITNSLLVDYKDVNCLREVSLYGIGQSFGVLDHLPGKQPTGAPPGPAWHTTLSFVDFDRFTITYKETAPDVFRVQKLVQWTESTFPLGNDPVAGLASDDRSPFAPDAPGNYTPISR
jgi:hypothetical protein